MVKFLSMTKGKVVAKEEDTVFGPLGFLSHFAYTSLDRKEELGGSTEDRGWKGN